MLSKKIKRREPCFFPEKLFKILKKKKNNHIIHWNEDGTKIVISDPIKFTVNILPKNFNHQNYSSFIRQLNLYGFSKINNIYNSKEEQFFNENFKRDKYIEEISFLCNGDNPSKKKLSEKKIKKQIIILDNIKKENSDKKKIEDFTKLSENGDINIKSNTQFQEFLIRKVEKKNNFDEKIRKEISRIKDKNKRFEKEINELKSKKNNSIEDNNKFLNISSHLKENNIKIASNIQINEPPTLKNEKLEEMLGNELKTEKVNDNKNACTIFSEEVPDLNNENEPLSMLFCSKNLTNQMNLRSSDIVLNKTRFLIKSNVNNENSRQSLTNSLLLKIFK